MTQKHTLILFVCLLVATMAGISQNVQPAAAYKLLAGSGFVQSKNYYLLTLLEQNREARKLVEEDTVLATIASNKLGRLAVALKQCKNDAFCLTGQMKFSDEEIQAVSERLRSLYSEGNAFGKLVQQHLLPSGTYILFKNSSPKELLIKAWEQDAAGINFAIGVYAEGKKPNYPAIDSISFQVSGNTYGGFMYSVAYLLLKECNASRLFFSLPLASALEFLELNERENAADFEPMISTVNKAAYEVISKIKWDAYKYSVILVPGAGPEKAGEALSAEAKLRCRLGALQYRSGRAPFIMVSGGRVHPYKTPYCEAFEMKKFLVDQLKIPEHAILVEPIARHTTTNMRNCVRMIFRYGIPFSKPGITCTTMAQSMMISTVLTDRCLKELNEVPYRNGERLSETESEFYPLIEALQINPKEPMDP
jgi:hypothetical protein